MLRTEEDFHDLMNPGTPSSSDDDHSMALIPAPEDGAEAAIGGAMSGDPYVLPSLMASVVLREIGFAAVNLGANVPIECLVDARRTDRLGLVWCSVSTEWEEPRRSRELRELLEALRPTGAEIVIGGRTVPRVLGEGAHHVHRFETMAELVGFGRALREPALPPLSSQRPA